MVLIENNAERYSRQRDIVPPDRLERTKGTVIGVGAIGRQVALQLAAMGVPWLQLVDFDVVEIENLAPQGFLEKDLGQRKVEATAAFCRKINNEIEIQVHDQRFRRSMEVGNMVFCCVDRIDTRRLIFEAVKDGISFFVDGRMNAEVIRVLTVCAASGRAFYPQTLFRVEEAHTGPCTAKSTIYTANIAAGLMVAQFTKHLRRLPVDTDLQVNLLTAELSVTQ